MLYPFLGCGVGSGARSPVPVGSFWSSAPVHGLSLVGRATPRATGGVCYFPPIARVSMQHVQCIGFGRFPRKGLIRGPLAQDISAPVR